MPQPERCKRIEIEWRLEEGLVKGISGGVDGMDMEMDDTTTHKQTYEMLFYLLNACH